MGDCAHALSRLVATLYNSPYPCKLGVRKACLEALQLELQCRLLSAFLSNGSEIRRDQQLMLPVPIVS